MKSSSTAGHVRSLRLGAALIGAAIALGGCSHSKEELPTASIPNDYRQRHPIAITEADRTVLVFVGSGRGGLTGSQRADVSNLAQGWLREGTAGIVAEVPHQTSNGRAAEDSLREIKSTLAAHGVPARAVTVRPYQPNDPRQFAAIRLTYPRVAATAGPCGLWPEDIGPSINNKGYLDNKPYWNLGCANQRNLAAMVDNPSDLVQPRPETPAYNARRATTYDTYRKMVPPTDKATLSDAGK